MKIHALVEGPSEEAFLLRWGKRFLKGHELRAYPHQGKGRLPTGTKNNDPRRRGLLDQLPAKLAAFGKSLDEDAERVLVIVDADKENWETLTRQLAAVVEAMSPRPTVFFGIAVEELEAFFLGDLKALATAFPDFDRKKAAEYVPDSICGTWELFGNIVGDGGGNKVAWAEAMGPVLTIAPKESRSPSFRRLCDGLRQLSLPTPTAKRTAKKPRKAKVATARDASGRRNR